MISKEIDLFFSRMDSTTLKTMIENLFKQNGQAMFVKKHDHIIKQNELNDALFYVIHGTLKAYYISVDGKENIKSFIQSGSMIGSLGSAYKQLPSTFNLLALEDSRLLKISTKLILQAAKDSHQVAEEVIEFLVNLSMKKELREYQFLMLSAEDRYVDFMQREPELVNKLTQNDVARYLGITPVALSRIKKRVADSSPQ